FCCHTSTSSISFFFSFNDPATTEIYTLSLHDALPIWKSTLAAVLAGRGGYDVSEGQVLYQGKDLLEMDPEERAREGVFLAFQYRSEEHTSELQSLRHLVCRLLLEKKKIKQTKLTCTTE